MGGDPLVEALSTPRECGSCSLCCEILRVDALRKLGGVRCEHQRPEGGCGIYAERPGICRDYRCLWLGGGLQDDDRPDALGAVLDVVAEGGGLWLEIREARPGTFDASPRLQEIAAEYRRSMPVRITDVADVLDAERSFRVLLPDGEEHEIRGDWITVRRPGRPEERRRTPWLDRIGMRLRQRWQRRRVRDYRGR